MENDYYFGLSDLKNQDIKPGDWVEFYSNVVLFGSDKYMFAREVNKLKKDLKQDGSFCK